MGKRTKVKPDRGRANARASLKAPAAPHAFPATPGTRHAPTSFASYKRAHEKRLQDFVEEGFITSHTVRFGEPKNGHITIEGEIRCSGGLRIAVTKKLAILKGKGPTAVVQTTEYTYHTYLEGQGNVLRYCGPTEHRPYHHVHRYDFLGSWAEKRPALEISDVNDVPTLGDVIEEVQKLYDGPEFSGVPEP